MKHLLSNSYHMWALSLAVVAMALGGGFLWWAMAGGDDFLEATGDAAQSCRQADPIQDVDILFNSKIYVDGKLEIDRTRRYHLSGESMFILAEYRPKESWVYSNGTHYHIDEAGAWTKVRDYTKFDEEFYFPFNADSICPNLENFTYVGDDKQVDQNVKKFIAPTEIGDAHDGGWPAPGEDPEIFDWVIWINDVGYIIKSRYSGRYSWEEGDEKWESTVTAIYSGHGEPNVIPELPQ